MKRAGFAKSRGIVIGAICLLVAMASGQAQAAGAQGRACAEVVAPAVIDSLLLSADAQRVAAAISTVSGRDAQRLPAEVRVTTVEGVTFVSIDFN